MFSDSLNMHNNNAELRFLFENNTQNKCYFLLWNGDLIDIKIHKIHTINIWPNKNDLNS